MKLTTAGQRNMLNKLFYFLAVPLLLAGLFTMGSWQTSFSVFSATNHDSEGILPTNLQEGDIIFQTSRSGQSKAIQLATHSTYSHMGIIYKRGGRFYVYEAGGTVRLTPLSSWIDSGLNGKYVIKRLKNAATLLTPDVLGNMKKVGEKFNGKPYDKYFEWSNDRIYCSELVWKIYKESLQLEIGNLKKLSDFDLTSKEVKTIMQSRYKGKIPYNEIVISPESMYNSDKLITVEKN
jgi:hypothetical protein